MRDKDPIEEWWALQAAADAVFKESGWSAADPFIYGQPERLELQPNPIRPAEPGHFCQRCSHRIFRWVGQSAICASCGHRTAYPGLILNVDDGFGPPEPRYRVRVFSLAERKAS